jgi:hypothetical protein
MTVHLHGPHSLRRNDLNLLSHSEVKKVYHLARALTGSVKNLWRHNISDIKSRAERQRKVRHSRGEDPRRKFRKGPNID